MLFDLRSRGRRRAIKVVYLGLAVLMGGGLLLFGVGAGNGFGGLLNAFTNSGSSGAAKAVVSQQEKQALAAINADPNSAANWKALVEARDVTAKQDYNSSTGQFTSAGLKELATVGQAWQQYLKHTTRPDPDVANLVAQDYDSLGDYKDETSAWQIVTTANPTVSSFYFDLARAAYLAHETDLGALAADKSVALAPKASRFDLKKQLNQLKTSAASSATATTTTGG
jgi:hypothetical protein